jgi:hypothetical protein
MDLVRGMIDRLSKMAEEKFAKYGGIAPLWFALASNGDTFIIPKMGPDKDLQAQFVRYIFREKDVIAYVFMDEAWVVEATMDTQEAVTKMSATVGLEHHPDRREVVVIHAEDETSNLSFHRDIIRPAGGRVFLGPLIDDHFSHSEGRFVGMLPRRGTLQ